MCQVQMRASLCIPGPYIVAGWGGVCVWWWGGMGNKQRKNEINQVVCQKVINATAKNRADEGIRSSSQGEAKMVESE